jgi:hypothetical protein
VRPASRRRPCAAGAPGPSVVGMRIRVIDAFTDRPFAGNPAAVCVLDGPGWPDAGWMQQVALAHQSQTPQAGTGPLACTSAAKAQAGSRSVA